jgi:crotonobetainyl-CoA:carnitine CoA-transferase CaiB-like acyl-CoA transferase
MKSAGALQGLRVIEAGSFIAGPFCGQLLGDLGAEVIKIEPPVSGDAMRAWGAVRAGNGQSLWWSVIGRNKQSVTLDLRRPEGQEVFRALLADADVLIENFRPGTLEGWGLSPDTLRALNPRLILARVSGFGQTGPDREKAGFAAVAEARAGLRHLTGYPDRPSTRVGISIGDSLAGVFAAVGVLSALVRRGQDGAGQVVDVAIADSVLAVMESVIAEQSATGAVRGRSGPVLPRIAPSNVYPAADGADILIAANADGLFRRLAVAMGQADLADDPRFATHHARGDHQAELDGRIAEWTRTLPADEILARMDTAGVPAGRVGTAAEVIADPHFRARGSLVEVTDPVVGPITMQGVVPRLSDTPGAVRWTGPPLGAHTDEVLSALPGFDGARIANLRQAGVL